MWGVAIILTLLIIFLGKILLNNQKDRKDLIGRTLAEKFSVIVNSINNTAFDGEGKIKHIKKNRFNLHQETSDDIVDFLYSQGMLSITWKYSYLEKEMVYKRKLSNARNLSLLEQDDRVQSVIRGMKQKIQEHKNNMSTIVNQ